jgi:hypothetical protein
MVDFCSEVTFVLPIFVGICDHSSYTEGIGMKWCLRDESIWERDSEETSYAGGYAEQENIPMKSCRFAERKFSTLGNEGRYY